MNKLWWNYYYSTHILTWLLRVCSYQRVYSVKGIIFKWPDWCLCCEFIDLSFRLFDVFDRKIPLKAELLDWDICDDLLKLHYAYLIRHKKAVDHRISDFVYSFHIITSTIKGLTRCLRDSRLDSRYFLFQTP